MDLFYIRKLRYYLLKFHKNQINQSTIAERRFSQPVADIITVTAYAGIGAGIWAIIKK